jgi:alkylation response protein AidB-like acyl-CoA dehydrogenase
MLPRETFEQIYQSGPDVVIAGSAVPTGAASRDHTGWRVTGRWPFASGCQQADWLLGVCVMTEGGKPVVKADGKTPVARAFFLPARDWTIEDTWHAAGLRGTGSTHIALNAARVPEQNFFDLATGEPCVSGPLYRALPYFVPLMHGAVHLGIARGALDDIVALAQTGWRPERADSPLRDSELFRSQIGRALADLRAAQAFYDTQVTRHWQHAVSGAAKDEDLLAQGVQTAVWIAATCVGVVETCFESGGAGAVFDSSPLQRRLRDIRVATQHGIVQRRNYASGGAMLLRQSGRSKARLGD